MLARYFGREWKRRRDTECDTPVVGTGKYMLYDSDGDRARQMGTNYFSRKESDRIFCARDTRLYFRFSAWTEIRVAGARRVDGRYHYCGRGPGGIHHNPPSATSLRG